MLEGFFVKLLDTYTADISLLREALYKIQETLCHRFLAAFYKRVAHALSARDLVRDRAADVCFAQNCALRKVPCNSISFRKCWQFERRRGKGLSIIV